jgi:hypothetical protein
MKKPAVIIGIIIVLALLIGVGVWFFNSSQPTEQNTLPETTFPAGSGTETTVSTPPTSTPLSTMLAEQSPSEFVKYFYTWYLGGLSKDLAFSTSDTLAQGAGQWLTGDFSNNWQNAIDSTGTDPALLTQDYQDSWLSSIAATTQSQTAESATVLVTLGTDSHAQIVTVTLLKINGAWRISAVQ